MLLVVGVLVILVSLFWRSTTGKPFVMGVSAYLGNLKGKVELEAFDGQYLYREDVPTMTLFYVDWCGHCKKVKPTWQQFMDKYKNQDDVDVVAIDCEKHKDLAKRFNISGYPTIKLFPKGMNNDDNVDYLSNRDLGSFIKFLESQRASNGNSVETYRNSVPSAFNQYDDDVDDNVVSPFP